MPLFSIPQVVEHYDPHLGQARSPDTQRIWMEKLQLDLIPEIRITKEQTRAQEQLRRQLHAVCLDLVEDIAGSDTKYITLLRPIGGHADGTAIQSSVLDFLLTVTIPTSEDVAVDLGMPMLLEEVLLKKGYGARLLSKAPHPILQLCTKPNKKLLESLRVEAARHQADRSSQTSSSSASQPTRPPGIPRTGAGLHCRIHFAFDIALGRAALINSYCLQDARIAPMVMFLKHWTRVRGINNPATGTFDSFTLILMVLYFTLYTIHPPVLKPLQKAPDEAMVGLSRFAGKKPRWVGHPITGWKWEANPPCDPRNHMSVGWLLRDFFYYLGWPMTARRAPNWCFKYDMCFVSIRPDHHDCKLTQHWQSAQRKKIKVFDREWVPLDVLQYNHLAVQDPWNFNINVADHVTPAGYKLIREEFFRAQHIQGYIGMERDTRHNIFEVKKRENRDLSKGNVDGKDQSGAADQAHAQRKRRSQKKQKNKGKHEIPTPVLFARSDGTYVEEFEW